MVLAVQQEAPLSDAIAYQLECDSNMQTMKWRKGLGLSIVFLALGYLTAGCSGPGGYADEAKSETSSPAPQGGRSAAKAVAQPADVQTASAPIPAPDANPATMFRQIVRSADLDVRVESVEKAERDVNRIVEQSGGFTETTSSTDLATHPVMKMVLRVPSPTFVDVVGKFEALGVRLAKSVETKDVTNQLAELESHLQALRAKEAIYRDMQQKRKPGENRYEIENQLSAVRNDIQTTLSQKKAQGGVAALSTISLTLEQGALAGSSGNDPKWLAESFGEATSAVSVVFKGVVTLAMWVGVFSPFWLPALFLIKKFGKRQVVNQPPKLVP